MKDIAGYEGLYGITSCGKVWSYRNKKFLKQYKDKYGYSYVQVVVNYQRKVIKIHRAVAEAYIPNPDGLETVDHIDGNKDHNYIGNLQWMTRADNAIKSNGIKVRCVETGEVFRSQADAARKVNGCNRGIWNVINGKWNTYKNYHWEVV